MQTKLSQEIELYHSNHGHARTTFIQIMVMQELYLFNHIYIDMQWYEEHANCSPFHMHYKTNTGEIGITHLYRLCVCIIWESFAHMKTKWTSITS